MSLILWYPLTGNGTNYGGLAGNAISPSFDNNGILGKCMKSTSGIQTGVKLTEHWNHWQHSVSMSCWVKLNYNECNAYVKSLTYNASKSATNATGCLIGQTSYGGLGIYWRTTNAILNSGSIVDLTTINFRGYTRGASGNVATSYYTVEFDKWYHMTLVADCDKKVIRFYVNGMQVANEVSYAEVTPITDVRYFGIGRAEVYGGNGPGGYLPMYVSDVRLYDHALSKAEVKELSRGLMLHYTFNDIANEGTTNIFYNKIKGFQGKWETLSETFNGSPVYRNTVTNPFTGSNQADNFGFCHSTTIAHTQSQATKPYIQLSFWKRLHQVTGLNTMYGYIKVTYTDGTTGQHSWTYSKSNWGNDATSIGKWEYITAQASLTAGKTVQTITHMYVYGRNATGGICDFACIQVEAKDHPTPYVAGTRDMIFTDESGYKHIGTGNAMELSTLTNCGSYSANFNGAVSFIQVPNWKPQLPNEPYTIMFWVKPNETKTRDVYWGNHNASSQTFNIERNASDYLRVYYNADTAIGPISAFTIPGGQWTHVAITFDGTTFYAYKNGSPVYSKALSTKINCDGESYRIGSDYRAATTTAEATRYYGFMSDFRIYATALSETDIQNICLSTVLIDKEQNIMTNEIIEDWESTNIVNAGSWEQNGIQDADGKNADGMMTRLRTKYIPVLPNASYYFKAATGYNVRTVHFYRENMTWISSVQPTTNSCTATTPSECAFIRWVVQASNASVEVPVANITTYNPVMVQINGNADTYLRNKIDVQVNKTYNIKTNSIVENHKAGFFKDGTASGNQFYEI